VLERRLRDKAAALIDRDAADVLWREVAGSSRCPRRAWRAT
jgi:hypothetical protein